MSSILKGLQLNEVNPNNYDSDWDYQDAVARSGRSRSRSSDSYDAHDAENDAYEMHKRFAATRARKEAEAKAAAEKLDELSPQTLASYKKKAGADATASDKLGNYARGNKRMSGIMQATKKEFANDAKGVAETTDDKPFDKMMTTIKQGTGKQKTLDRKEQQKQTQQRARDAFGNMFGGGNPADKLKIREQGVAEDNSMETPQQKQVRAAITKGLEVAKQKDYNEWKIRNDRANKTGTVPGDYFDVRGYASDKLTGIDSIEPDGTVVISLVDNNAEGWVKKLAALGGMPGVKTRQIKMGQGVAEAGIPFRGVGGAFNRGDDERHDLDVAKPQVWGLKINGKVWSKGGVDVTFTNKQAAVNTMNAILKNRPDLQGKISLVTKGGTNEGIVSAGQRFYKPRHVPNQDELQKQGMDEEWSQKYKSSINCSHPKGFSQKAHCAGKKKHNESVDNVMEMTCPDCGMCQTHGDHSHDNLDEACWKGYHKEGMKTMFGKQYPDCRKNTKEGVAEEQHSCPHCGGEMVSEELMNEKKDACYYKVKSRYKVWPSAYASGALVKCRNKGASNWGNGGKKNESSILEGIEQADESLHDWFNKEKWVRMDTKGNIKGPCAKEPGEGKPKCLPQSKAHSLGKKGRASAAQRKRREDPNPDRHGAAINVNTKKKSNENIGEGWKEKLGGAALAGAMAFGGAGHAQAADLSGYNTQYLQQVAQGNHPRPMVNVDDAKAELQARVDGKQQRISEPAQAEAPKGFSMEYLQKAADPNRFGRYLISIEKAQELLKQAQNK